MSSLTTPVRPEFATVTDVSLRYAVSVDSVRRLIADGVLPAYTIPGLRGVRIRLTDADALPRLIDPNGFAVAEGEV